MCTLSFIARGDGYLLGMNRDERLARGGGLPLEGRDRVGGRALYPTDGAGGTWIAANEYGVALAVLNWNEVAQAELPKDRLSRGTLLPALIAMHSSAGVDAVLGEMELKRMMPFRMVGVLPAAKEIAEWRWDGSQIALAHHEWEARHWFSSGLGDRQAELERADACARAWRQQDAGSSSWLRRLHASHGAAAGPFSICVHRPDARTMSYSEIECTPSIVRMRHAIGSPCTHPAWNELSLERAGSGNLQPESVR